MRLMSIVTASVVLGATTGLSSMRASAQNYAAVGAAIPTCDYTYAPFGDSSATGSLAQSNPWRFSSEYADDELGCVYYNYRHYEPTTGRWLSRDPIFKSNAYLFVPLLFDFWGADIYPYDWNSLSFIRWYFYGEGQNVDLSQWSKLNDFRDDIEESLAQLDKVHPHADNYEARKKCIEDCRRYSDSKNVKDCIEKCPESTDLPGGVPYDIYARWSETRKFNIKGACKND